MAPFEVASDEINGELGFKEHSKVHEPTGLPKMNGDAVGENSPKSVESISNSNSNVEVSSAPTKGYGLKKWRRIRRDLNKDGSGSVDSALIHKRRFSINETSKSRDDRSTLKNEVEVETLALSVGSIRSVEAAVGAALPIPFDPKLVQLAASNGFSIGMDSDNSEDLSSKSSMAASVPKPRHEIGYGRERGRSRKNVGGRGVGNSLHQRRSGIDAGKKIRGNRVTLEKENSQSSVESDLRSSNVGVRKWGSGLSNGRHSEKSLNFDPERGYEAQKRQEIRSGYYKENGLVANFSRENSYHDILQEEVKVKRGNLRQSPDIDPFVESIVKLQEAQDALEAEIQQIGEIGKETVHENSNDQSEEAVASSSLAFDPHSYELNLKIEHLQSRLEEVSATVKANELEVLELENIIKRTQLPKRETCSAYSPLIDMHNLKHELDDILMKKIQAEVELMVARTTRSWKFSVEDQIALLDEQKSLARNQTQVMLKLKDTENKAIKLKEQTESYCEKISDLKLHNEVCKSSLCFFVQLLLLFVAFGLFLIQLMPPSLEIVPT